MVGAVKSSRGVEGMQVIDPFYDPSAAIDVVSRGIKQGEAQVAKVINPLEGKWALADTVEALENIKTSFLGDGMAAQLYQNLILYPKATSQMAKTVLAPVTHSRNFMSASMHLQQQMVLCLLLIVRQLSKHRQAVQIFGQK
jgi:hypothetical protein